MNDTPNPFAIWMNQVQDMAKSMQSATDAFTPTAFEKMWPTMPKDVMEATMGKGVSPDGLDAKTKMLLTLAGLTVLGAQAEAQLRMTVRHAVEAGASKQEVLETIGMMGLFGGIPAMNKAMTLATDVIDGAAE